MAATPIVKDLNVSKEVSDGCVPRCVTRAMHSFVLQAIEEADRRGVVPAVSFAAHRADYAVRCELVLERMTGILAPAIRVMQQTRCRFAAEPRHGQRIDHEVRRHARLTRPAHDFAIEQIQHDGEV